VIDSETSKCWLDHLAEVTYETVAPLSIAPPCFLGLVFRSLIHAFCLLEPQSLF